MDTILLSRWQFGITSLFHFLFPPLTIGLALIIAIFEYIHWRTKNTLYDSVARFWSKLFVIIFTVGVATGIPLEFQFGTNWSPYSKFVGDVFGAPLAAEGIFAFFLESTFFGLLIYGRDKISAGMRAFSAAMVSLGSMLSAFWIIVANSWMQTPAGYQIQGGRAILTDFLAAVFNPSTMPRYVHTLVGAFMTGSFFVLGISAYFLLRAKNTEIAKASIRIAVVFAFAVTLFQLLAGDFHTKQVGQTQQIKIAAFEGLWETTSRAPLIIGGLPDLAQEKNFYDIAVPGLLSWLAHGDINAPVQGLKAFPRDQWPPILPTFFSFHLMAIIWMYLTVVIIAALYLLLKKKLYVNRTILKLLLYSIPLPLLANELGWITAEMGRQPWIVYGVLRTYDAGSPQPVAHVLLTVTLITLLYTMLIALVVYLMKQEITKAMQQG